MKKILSLFALVLMSCMGAWAQSFPAEGTYYMTFTNGDATRRPYIHNSVADRRFTLQSATLPSPLTNDYVWKVVTDGTDIISMTDGTGQNVGVNGQFVGRLDGHFGLQKQSNGRYYITSAQIKNAQNDHECLNRSNGGFANNGEWTVTTWVGAGNADNQWSIEAANFEGDIYDVEVTGADGYATFNGQNALNGGFFFANSIAAADVQTSVVPGHEATVTVVDHTIKVNYVQTATSVDVTYKIYVGEELVYTSEPVGEYVDEAPTYVLPTIPAYVEVTQGLPATIAEGVTEVVIRTQYTGALPFKLDGTKYNIKENRSPNLWIFFDGSALKTVANQVPTYENQDNYKWIIGGDWFNGFTLKNVAENKYVTYESVDPNNKDAVLTETLGVGAYFDLVQQNSKNYFKIHGTTVNAYISNRGGASKQELTHWNNGSNIGDAGSQLIFSEAEEIEAPAGPAVTAEKFYRLKNKKSDGKATTSNGETHIIGYMDATSVRKGTRNFAFNGYGDIANATFSQVFQFVPSGDNYYLKAQGSYMSKLVDGSLGCTENQNDAALFSISATTNEGYYYLIDTKQSNNNWKYAQLSDYWGFGIGGWYPQDADNDLRCQWAFEEVESVDVALTTVGEASYATLYAPYAVSLDSNVKAYTATVSGEYLVAAEVTGVVPAFSAVILVSESAAEKATATLVNSDAAALTSDLQGVCRATAANGELVLGLNEGELGFYTFTGATLGANKAYYAPAADESNLRISFDTLTSIISAAKENGGQAIFDLQGRRVVNAQNGLYIVNGKKVIR